MRGSNTLSRIAQMLKMYLTIIFVCSLPNQGHISELADDIFFMIKNSCVIVVGRFPVVVRSVNP